MLTKVRYFVNVSAGAFSLTFRLPSDFTSNNQLMDSFLQRAAWFGSFLGGITTAVVAFQAIQLNEGITIIGDTLLPVKPNLTELPR